MRVRFVKENLARLAEQYRGYLGEKDLEDNKEYTVYGLLIKEISWYLICSRSFDEYNSATFPVYLPAQLFEVVDPAYSVYWTSRRTKEKGGKVVISADYPYSADESFLDEWVENGGMNYMNTFLRAKKEMDAEDALRSVLLDIPKDNTKVVMIDGNNPMPQILSDISDSFLCKDFRVNSTDDLYTLLLNLDRYTHERKIWFIFYHIAGMGIKESQQLSEVLEKAEAYWDGHKDVIDVSSWIIDEDNPLYTLCK